MFTPICTAHQQPSSRMTNQVASLQSLLCDDKDSLEGIAVPPMSLHQAGVACVCRSKAWDGKVITSAWWVFPEQVYPAAHETPFDTVKCLTGIEDSADRRVLNDGELHDPGKETLSATGLSDVWVWILVQVGRILYRTTQRRAGIQDSRRITQGLSIMPVILLKLAFCRWRSSRRS